MKHLNEIHGGTEGANDVCDFTACNGLLYEVEIDGEVEIFGQCQANLKNDPFCFVNEASICKKERSKTKPGKFPRHHWSHWCCQWSTLVKLRRVNGGAERYKTVLGGEIQHCTVANELKLFFRQRISTLLPMNWQFAHRIAHLPLRGQPGWLDLEQDQFRNYHDCHHLHHDHHHDLTIITIMIMITWKATCM